jgi:hypothetical protein
MKDREWRVQMEAERTALRRRLAAVEAVLAELRPAAAPQSRSRPKGQAPFGWRYDETGGLIAVPEQQAAIRQMRRMKDRGLSLREIAGAMRGAGIKISHMTVKNALDAAASGPTAGELIEGRYVYVHDRATRHPEAAPRDRHIGEPAAPDRLTARRQDPGQDSANPIPTAARRQRRALDRREDGQ